MDAERTAAAIELRGVVKSYPTGPLHRRRRGVLKGLDLEVHQGEIFGYLGPNGSGKTTTIKILMGLVFADSGHGQVLGCPLGDHSWRARVGFLPEQPYFYDYLTPVEYLDYCGRLFGLDSSRRRAKTEELLELVVLGEARNVPMRRFSKGMAQRLGLAQALVNDPELLVLDEPMSGLDPVGRRLVRDLILTLRKRNKTIFLSTHILHDAEQLCDRVAVLHDGAVAQLGRIDEILAIEGGSLEVLLSGPREAVSSLPVAETVGERFRSVVADADLPGFLAAAQAKGCRVVAVNRVRKSLEDYFVTPREPGKGERWGDLG